MATRTMEEIDKITDMPTKLKKLKSIRKGVKFQITNARKCIQSGTLLSQNEIKTRLNLLDDLKVKYDLVQDRIDILTEEDDLTDEFTYREDIENITIETKAKLLDGLKTYTNNGVDFSVQNSIEDSLQSSQKPATRLPILPTSNLNFIPFDEREKFSNFARRLEVFMTLKGINEPKMKTFTLLHALTPLLHQKLYDLCNPDNPLNMEYEDLVEILNNYLDPKASVLAVQHSFIIRTQQDDESVSDFSTELKRLSTNCQFQCSACGKSVCDVLLRLQFIRGLKDNEIKTRLLQDHHIKPFNEIVNTATTIELSKRESTIITHKNITQNIHQVRSKITDKKKQVQDGKFDSRNTCSDTTGAPTTSTTKTLDFHRLKGKCYRCGNIKHRANTCPMINETCHACGKIGHISRVCLSRSKLRKSAEKVHCTDDIESGEENIHEINILSEVKKNEKFYIEVKVEGKNVKFELDTGASLTSISYQDYTTLIPNKRLYKTGVELRTYTGEIIRPKGVTYVKCKYKDQYFSGKLYVINQAVDRIFGREWMREIQLDWAEIKSLSMKNHVGSNLDSLLTKYEELFDKNIGCIPNYEAKLNLKENSNPIYVKARQAPYALKAKLKKAEKPKTQVQPPSKVVRRFHVGDRVQAYNFREREGKWSFGRIIGTEGDVVFFKIRGGRLIHIS